MKPIELFKNLYAFTGTLTSDATNPDTGGTFSLGDIVYTFRTTLSSPTVPNEIKIGVDAATTLDNVKAAVNASGTAGTEYSVGTLQNPLVDATTNTNTTQLFVIRSSNTSKREIRFEENSTHLSCNGNGKFVGEYTQAPSTVNYDFDLPDDCKGLVAILDITAEVATATLDVKFQYRDPIKGVFVDVPGASFAQKSAVGTSQLSIYPGLTASANVAVTQVLTKTLRCVAVEAGAASSFTYTLNVLPIK